MFTGILLLVIWHFGRKPTRGSLRLSRRQGDRNRAIRVQQEPLRFYEEVLLTIGDVFDFLVDGVCELLGMAWKVLKMTEFITWVPQLLESLLGKKELSVEELAAKCGPEAATNVSAKAPKAENSTRRRESREVTREARGSSKTTLQETVKVTKESQVGSNHKAKMTSEIKVAGENRVNGPNGSNGHKGKPTPQEAVKVTSESRVNSSGPNGPNGPKAKATPPEAVKVPSESRINSSNGKAKATPPEAVKAGRQGPQGAQGPAHCLEAKTASQGVKVTQKPDVPSSPEMLEPSPMYKAALAVMKANAEAAAKSAESSSPVEDLEGSTDGSVPPAVDVVDDETAHTESEDCDMGCRPNTAAAAQAILAAASDKRAAALQLLDAAAMPTIEVRTFLADPDEISQAPVMRRTVSDSDVVFYD